MRKVASRPGRSRRARAHDRHARRPRPEIHRESPGRPAGPGGQPCPRHPVREPVGGFQGREHGTERPGGHQSDDAARHRQGGRRRGPACPLLRRHRRIEARVTTYPRDDRAALAPPGSLRAPRHRCAQRGAAARPARLRQDTDRPCHCSRDRGGLLLRKRSGDHPQVLRRERGSPAQDFRGSGTAGSEHHLSR